MNRPTYVLYDVLKEAKTHKEDCFIADYNNAIKSLKDRDKK